MKTKSITKVTLLSIVVVSVITAVTLNSCQKESIKPKALNSSTQSKGKSNLSASSMLLMKDLNNMLFASKKSSKGLVAGGIDSNSCVIVTRDTVDKPNTAAYSYATSCVGSDGSVRSGKVTITYADPDIRTVNNVITVTYQNYSVNGILHNGSISVTNYGPNGSGNLVLAEVGTVTALNTQTNQQGLQQIVTDTLNVNYQLEWIAGEGSSPAANLQFSITGGVTSSFAAGQADSVVIVTPLIKNSLNAGCNFYIQGTQYTVTHTIMGLHYRYEDFGNPGGCGGQESVTEDGITTVEAQ
jgi:hypothetical protein